MSRQPEEEMGQGGITLTIVTPVFNGVQFVEKCLENVLQQWESGVEHLIVDGGSTDGTVEAIQRFAADNDYVRWHSERDSGQSDALNRGIRMARGKIVSVLNVDDSYCPGAIREALSTLAHTAEPAFVVGNTRVEDADGRECYTSIPENLSVEDILIARSGTIFPINPASYFYHKLLHDEVGLFDIQDHFTMDLDFLLRAFARVRPIHVARTWAVFRLHGASKTAVEMEFDRLRSRKHLVYARYRRRLPLGERWRCAVLFYYFQLTRAIYLVKTDPAKALRMARFQF